MTLSERITSDMKVAMKAKQNATLSTLRLLRSAVKNKSIDLRRDLTDEEVLAVIKTTVKQLKDSAESFAQGDREEMAASALVEIEVLRGYLPEELSDEDLEAIIKTVIEQSGAQSKADMGRVMGEAMKAAQGRAEGNRVKDIVMKLLPVVVLAVILAPQSAFASGIPIIEAAADPAFTGDMIVIGLKMLRVIILWFGVGALVTLLNGGFGYMTASMRDDAHHAAIRQMTVGVGMSMIVAGTFAVTTVVLNSII